MRRYKFTGYTLIVIGLYIIWSSIVLPMSADHTSLCGRCHATAQAYKTAYFSAHRDIGCLACHRNPGIGGRLAADFRGLRNTVANYTKEPSNERRVENDACLACHDEIMDEVVEGKKIKMSHREVIDAGWRCGECHGATGHTLSGIKAKLQNPSMDKCFGCHLNETRLRKCGACHVGPIVKGAPKKTVSMGNAAHTADWRRRGHGQSSQELCSVCHERTFCKRCHKVSLPHPKGTWPYDHGAAAKIDEKPCMKCHGADFCLNCHRMPMPHEKDYNRRHMVGTAGIQAVCLTCHLQSQCEACHRAHKKHGV